MEIIFPTSVATTFKSNTSVLFDLYNEPYTTSWSCWLNGSTVAQAGPCTDVGFTVAGMQTLVNAVRATGATTPLLLGGLAYSNDLSQWLQYKNQWPGGFTGTITISDTGSTVINVWTLVFTFPGSQQVTQGSNGIFSQQGSKVTVVNESYNATLAPGASLNPGFNGSWTGSNPAPTSFTLNGMKYSIS